MAQVGSPQYKVLYNQKDITSEVGEYLISLIYTDAVEGKADSVQLELTNSTGIWTDEWYPTMGDTLDVWMGNEAQLFKCGTFVIDEFQADWGPDIIKIKGISASINDATRQKRGDQQENKTLRQIAQKIADRYGYSLSGNIRDTGQISRVTQPLESDICFLRRISEEYGHAFSIRGGVITFTDLLQLEAIASAATVSKRDLLPGSSIKDKSYDTYKKLHLLHYDTNAKKVLETEFEFPTITNADGFSYNDIVKKDIKEVRVRFDNQTQGDLKAEAALHSSNSKQQEGILLFRGNPFVLAGNNFTLTEMGKLSGVYHVMSSTHKITKSGYVTEAQIKRVGYVDVQKTKPKHKRKPKPVTVKIIQ